ncbi:MAG: winged helix-turn-helix domain-containing protein, partial [Actinomycetota bacterium]|nr:winged helix-turn-helix domain-containing protein [Actinomycetota bacterium]
WHQNYTPHSRTLDVHIRQLRAKLEEVSAPVVIENMRGVGYRIVSVHGDEPR